MDLAAENDDLKRRLAEHETRHRLLVESWAQAEWETNAAGEVVADSPSWRAYTGQTLAQWLGFGWLDAIHPDDRAYAERQWREAMAARRRVDAEFRLRAPDGGWRWTNVRAAPVLDEAGNIEKWAGINFDIDARKRAEADLRESEMLRLVALAGGRMGTWNWDLDARTCGGDAQFMALWGFPPSDHPRPLSAYTDRMTPVGAAEMEEIVTRAVAAGDEFDGPLEIVAGPRAGHWIRWRGRATAGSPRMLHGVTFDITEQKRAEERLRASEERQAFLLKLSDLLRPLSDPAAIQHAAMKLLAKQHDVMRAGYLDVHGDGDTMTMAAHFERDAVPAPPQIRLSDYGPDLVAAFHAGYTRYVRDTIAEAETEEQRAAYRVLGVQAWIIAPVVKGGRLTAIVGVVSRTSRDWTPIEIQLVTDLAERTWDAVQRARSEAELRESEERFAQFARASSAGLWIRAADTLAMEFVSPAVGTIYGAELDALLGDVKRWAAMIVPEDRDIALDHLEAARRGETVVHEFRIQRPSDGAFRWIRNTDFPLRDDGHIPRIGGIAEDVSEAKLAAEHSAVLLAELQHRVRNIMALLRSITNRTGERAESVSEYRDLMMGRLLAFARVQALLTRTANVSVGIASIVRDEVSVQAQHEGQYVLDGPDVALSPKAAEVLTLAIHELATNAVKYGALAASDGRVTVRWSTFERRGGPWLAFDWTEEGAPERPWPTPDAPRRRGFGSELIEGRIPYELRGRGQVTIEPGGARCHLEFPLQDGASILETGAPQRATVFGGGIDMTGEPDLTGRRILVVEDDYYLATDAARALRGAGAEVMGPCATEEDARAELAEGRPDAVVVDINLGPGPSFKLAQTLKDRGIPFVFTTGYDAEVIPAEFAGVERLEKPLQLRQIVGAVAKMTRAG